MGSGYPLSPSQVLLNIGGKKYATTIDTLTQREPDSMLAAMFSGRHTVSRDPNMEVVFIDRDGKHFRHILNWLRDGVISTLGDSEYQQLLREAEYYQLLGLVEFISANMKKKKDDDGNEAELTRKDVIKSIQSKRTKFRGVNLCGLDLSKLDLSFVDFSYACIKKTNFSSANLNKAKLGDVEADDSIFQNANLRECEFIGAKLSGAVLDGANLQSANLQDACLVGCSFCYADLRSAHLQPELFCSFLEASTSDAWDGVDAARFHPLTAKLMNANLEGANLEGANLKGAKLSGANLQHANLQRAYLREVDLRDTQLEGAKLGGANLLGAIR